MSDNCEVPVSLKDTIKPLQMGEAFADLAHVDLYLTERKFPAIHDDMAAAMDLVPKDERIGALDLGACHGLLSVRAKTLGWDRVVGVDIDQRSVDIFNQYLASLAPGVTMEQATINVLTPGFERWLQGMRNKGLDTILARRIFPELFVTTFKARSKPDIYMAAGRAFGQIARDVGFHRIILEGRIWKQYWNMKRGNPLFRAEREMVVLGPGWKKEFHHEECISLVPS
jgi:hypothetical protein